VGFGFSRPLVQGKSEKKRQKNRRVEFHIIDDITDTGQDTAPAPEPEKTPAELQ
jgi:hypothetical protein